MADTVIPFRRYGKLDGAPVRASIDYNYKKLTEADRSRLANAHIDIFEQKLRMLNPHLRIDEATRNRIHSIAMDPHNSSPEAIMQSVIAATSETMPASAQDYRERFQSQYDIDGHKHHSDTARQMMRMAFDRYASGGRYGELGGGEQFSQADTATIAAAMNVAREYGMTWMAPRDLLAIGPAGVKAIGQTNLKEAGYKALREEAFYEAKDVVTFAKHAKIKGFDAEKAAHATRDLVQAQPAEQQQALADVLKGYDRAVVDAHERPNDPAARQRLEEAGQRQKAALQAIAAQSREQAERVRRLEETKKVEQQFRATATTNDVKADTGVEKLVVKEQAADDLYAQAAAQPDTKSKPTKQVDAGTAAPKDGATTKIAAVTPKVSTPKV